MGGAAEQETMRVPRKSARHYLPALILALTGLYLALPGVSPSAAETMPVVISLQPARPADPEDLALAGEVLKQRLSSYPYPQGGAQPAVAVEEGRLVVALPPQAEPSVAVAEAGRVGRVEVVDGGTQFLPVGKRVKTGPYAIPDQNVYQTVLTSADFVAAEARLGKDGRPVIDFILTAAGDARLAAHTAQLRGYYLCLLVDNRVVNCPILRTPLVNRRGTIELTGEATLDEARILVMLLQSGPLPVPLKLAAPSPGANP